MAKTHDLVVKVGTYMKDGKEKNRYVNVGVVLEGQYGPYILLNRHFNPAGVPCDPNKDSVIVSMFSDKPTTEGSLFSRSDNYDIPF